MNDNITTVVACESEADAPLWYGISRFERATSAEVERHVPIVRKMIELYGYGDALSYDEKVAAGLIGVAIAVERFDASRGVKYAYWLSYQIDKAIRNENRLVMRQRRLGAQPLDDAFDPIDEREWDARMTEDEREERAAKIEHAVAALQTLDSRAQFIVRKLCFEGKTQTEVARELGISQSRTSRIAREAYQKLRREIERRERQERFSIARGQFRRKKGDGENPHELAS